MRHRIRLPLEPYDGFPILKRCFKDYYYDAKVEVVELNVFQEEVKMFSEKFLPVDGNFDKLFEQLMKVIHVAIELQRPIVMAAD
jgi:hypothetical protein